MKLPAPDLIDRKPAERAGAEQFKVAGALADRAQARTLAPQIFRAESLQRVGLGRPLGRLDLLFRRRRIVTRLCLAQCLGSKLARR